MVKVISLSDNAYDKLQKIKMNRSFSEIVIELVDGKQKRNLRDFSGIFSKEEGKIIKKQILENRRKQKTREIKL